MPNSQARSLVSRLTAIFVYAWIAARLLSLQSTTARKSEWLHQRSFA